MNEKGKLEKRIEASPKMYIEKKQRKEERLWNKIKTEPKIKAAKRARKHQAKMEDEAKKRALFPNYE